jgi:gliding motility-associated-like protein
MHTLKRGLLFFLLLLISYAAFPQATEAWYIRRTAPEPWTWCPVLNTNITEMDNVFGVGGWNSGFFTTVDVADAFGPDSKFVFLEGGDDHAIDLKNFLTTNITTIENWVYNGGSLFLNAAPNEGSDINFGFGGVLLDYTPGSYASSVDATDPTHPIFLGPFTPTGLTWTGTSYTHAKVTGPCLITLIEESFSGYNAAAEKRWGAGVIIFGGMTVTGWHSPFTQARNVRQNILSYLYNFEGTLASTFTYADSIYCPGDVDPFPVFEPGADTGTFTATPVGMVIDPETGVVDIDASEPGTYVITNGAVIDCIPAAFTMIIGTNANANFVYFGSPYCSTEPDKSPNFLLGGVAGTFTSAPAGLVINPATGVIDIGASTPGTYTVTNTVTTEFCGDAVATAIVTIDPAYDIVEDVEICSGTFYTLPDGTDVTVAGTYVNNFITGAGCDSIITTNLTVNATYAITVNAAICEGEVYVLPDGTNATTPGAYVQLFPSAAGCDSAITTILDVNPVYDEVVNTAICNGELYTLPDGTTTGTMGTYNHVLTTVDGCDSTIVTHLMVFPTYASANTINICSGETYTLPDGTITGVAGVYVSNLLTEYDCDSIITTTLIVDPVYNPIINAEICEGFTYTLPDGIVVSTSGTYTTSYTTIAGCDSIITTNLIVNPNPVIIFEVDDIVCIEDVSFPLNAYPTGGIYSGSGVVGSDFSPATAGVGGPYVLTYEYTDANGCFASATVSISVDENTAEAWGDTTIFAGEKATLYSITGGDYNWSPPTQLICTTCPETPAYPLENTLYTITSYNANGCLATDNVFIEVLPNPGNTTFIPNTFTPNGDNINDFFFAYGYNLATIKSMRIFDRWGSMIFIKENISANNESEGWDGTYNGEILNQGVYAYMVEITYNNGITIHYNGNITLVR